MRGDTTEFIHKALAGSKGVRALAGAVQKSMEAVLRPRLLHRLKTFLNGTWLEHPLHPLLTDLPIGAWTAAIVLELMDLVFGLHGLGPATAIATGLGLLAALATVATGLTDWMDIDPPELAVGIIHALLNFSATLLFALSFVLMILSRWQVRAFVFWPAAAGYLLLSVGSYLGGSLVFRMGVMINRNAYLSGPRAFLPVLPVQDLPENQLKRVQADGTPVLLLRGGDRVFALAAVCSHYGAPLEKGHVEGDILECPWHSSRYRLEDGAVIAGPATAPLPSFETRIQNGQIEVKLK